MNTLAEMNPTFEAAYQQHYAALEKGQLGQRNREVLGLILDAIERLQKMTF